MISIDQRWKSIDQRWILIDQRWYQLIKYGDQLIKNENISQNINIIFCQGELLNVCLVVDFLDLASFCLLGMIQNQL